jgi:hypothetical protein
MTELLALVPQLLALVQELLALAGYCSGYILEGFSGAGGYVAAY